MKNTMECAVCEDCKVLNLVVDMVHTNGKLICMECHDANSVFCTVCGDLCVGDPNQNVFVCSSCELKANGPEKDEIGGWILEKDDDSIQCGICHQYKLSTQDPFLESVCVDCLVQTGFYAVFDLHSALQAIRDEIVWSLYTVNGLDFYVRHDVIEVVNCCHRLAVTCATNYYATGSVWQLHRLEVLIQEMDVALDAELYRLDNLDSNYDLED